MCTNKTKKSNGKHFACMLHADYTSVIKYSYGSNLYSVEKQHKTIQNTHRVSKISKA